MDEERVSHLGSLYRMTQHQEGKFGEMIRGCMGVMVVVHVGKEGG